MVGLATLLFLLSLWYFAAWVFKAAHAEELDLPLGRRRGGRALVVTLEAGGSSPRSGDNPGSCATT